MHDVKYAFRALGRSPGFAAAAIVTLALGIGANTAIFSVVHAVLIAPLPYRDPGQLVFVWCDLSSGGYPRAPLSGPELNDLRDRTTRFSEFGAIWATTAALTGESEPEQLRIGLVTPNFFPMLGVEPAVGRAFGPDDESQAAPRAILLGYPLWQRRFGADPHIAGRLVEVNGQQVTVAGVMPADFRLLMPPDANVPDDLQAWMLFNANVTTRGARGQKYLRVVGRMKPNVSLEQARTDINSVAAGISREFADYGPAGRAFTTVGLQADDVRQLRPMLLVLFAGVVLLLTTACVNVANLLVARAASRVRETAVRMSLGAGAGRLARQSLTEGLVLAALGGAAGLAVGYAGLRALLALRPESLGRLGLAHIDGTVLAFTIATTAVWGVLFSLAPAAEATRTDVAGLLRRQGARPRGGVRQRIRSALVVLQIALSVMLLVGSALIARTFLAIQRVDPGFRSDHILTFKIAPSGARYASPDAYNAFARSVQEQLAALPAVNGVGTVSHIPYDNVPNWGGPYITERGADESKAPFADNRAVSPGFFETVGARLVEGRFFNEGDVQREQPVVIVDDQLARRAWPGHSAIGQEIAADPFSTGHPVFRATVIGVVAHLRHRSLLENLGDQVYFAERQVQRNPLIVAVRTDGDPTALVPAIRRVMAAIDASLPVYDVRPMAEYVVGARAAQRFAAVLAATFAMVALLLASVGVYGVVAYATDSRRYEFGVRLALGARPRDVITLVLREGAALTAAGLALGVVGALAGTRVLRGQLFGVSETDLASYVVAVLAIGAVAAAASWLPARRASGISPMTSMKRD
jgi:putative ABC transport system permease protein